MAIPTPAVSPQNLRLHHTALRHGERLDSLETSMGEVKKTLGEHSVTLAEHSSDLAIIKQTLGEHTVRFDVMEDRFDRLENKVDAGFVDMRRQFAEVNQKIELILTKV